MLKKTISVNTILLSFIFILNSCVENGGTLSSDSEILEFNIQDHQVGITALSKENKTITIKVLYSSTLENLIANFTISEGSNAYIGDQIQESGITVNDFTSPKVYRIEAEDGQTSTNWTISVTKSDAPEFIVSTLVQDFPGNDGISVDGDGNIYVNSNGLINQWNGTTIHKITPDGASVSLFADNLPQWPVGSIFDSEGNLYVTGWRPPGYIIKILPDGTKETFTSGLGQPSGLEIDNDGNLFVMEPPIEQMTKITPNGNKSAFATGSSFNTASGITYDKSTNTFYVSNWSDGTISKVTSSGQVSNFVTLPVSNLGPILLVDNYIYVTNPNGNKIFRIDKNTKEYSVIAGAGPRGNNDGAANFATFNSPIGIGISNDHKLIYVSEISPSGAGRLRIIQPYEE